MKHKILQINKFYYPHIGGVETIVKQYAEYLTKNNEVCCLTINNKFKLFTKTEKINNVTVVRCGSLGTFFSMPISLSFFFKFLRIRKNFDIFHFHEPFPLASILYCLIPKSTKVIVSWHSDIIKQKFFKKFAEYFQKKLCIRSDIIITTSQRLFYNSHILQLFKDKVNILPLSIDPQKYEYININNISKELKIKREYILYLGRFSYYKGIDVLLKAISQLNDNLSATFVIAGSGKINKQLSRKISTLKNKNVILINRFLNEDEKKYLLKHCLFFVFPSKYPSEAFGIIQLEAMIYGKPVINTDLPTGVPYVSQDGLTGLTVPANDHKALSYAISKLLNDRKLIEIYGLNAKKRLLENFTDNIVLDKLKLFYDKI
jgi:rhamnosyl/mannosyltransferase